MRWFALTEDQTIGLAAAALAAAFLYLGLRLARTNPSRVIGAVRCCLVTVFGGMAAWFFFSFRTPLF
jgi:hypothetical protein